MFNVLKTFPASVLRWTKSCDQTWSRYSGRSLTHETSFKQSVSFAVGGIKSEGLVARPLQGEPHNFGKGRHIGPQSNHRRHYGMEKSAPIQRRLQVPFHEWRRGHCEQTDEAGSKISSIAFQSFRLRAAGFANFFRDAYRAS